MEKNTIELRNAAALEGMKLLKEWITWLVTIETAVIGGLFVGLKDVAFSKVCLVSYIMLQCDTLARCLASSIILLFGIAIIAALYLLLALPALAERMPHAGNNKDFFSMRTAAGLRLQLFAYVRVVRWCSLWGFMLVAALMLLLIWTRNS